MPIIGRFQNKPDLVPGLDKFTGIHSEVTNARDCTFLCLLASCCFALSSWMRSFKTTPCKTDWFIKNQSTEGISSNLRHLLANWSIGAKEYFTLGSKIRTSLGVFNFRSCKIHVYLKCQNASRILQQFKTYFFFFFFLLTEKYLW